MADRLELFFKCANLGIDCSMNRLVETTIICPYCGEFIDVLIDCSEAQQEYIEDCQVCCRPIVFTVNMSNNGEPTVSVRDENETY